MTNLFSIVLQAIVQCVHKNGARLNRSTSQKYLRKLLYKFYAGACSHFATSCVGLKRFVVGKANEDVLSVGSVLCHHFSTPQTPPQLISKYYICAACVTPNQTKNIISSRTGFMSTLYVTVCTIV